MVVAVKNKLLGRFNNVNKYAIKGSFLNDEIN